MIIFCSLTACFSGTSNFTTFPIACPATTTATASITLTTNSACWFRYPIVHYNTEYKGTRYVQGRTDLITWGALYITTQSTDLEITWKRLAMPWVLPNKHNTHNAVSDRIGLLVPQKPKKVATAVRNGFAKQRYPYCSTRRNRNNVKLS